MPSPCPRCRVTPVSSLTLRNRFTEASRSQPDFGFQFHQAFCLLPGLLPFIFLLLRLRHLLLHWYAEAPFSRAASTMPDIPTIYSLNRKSDYRKDNLRVMPDNIRTSVVTDTTPPRRQQRNNYVEDESLDQFRSFSHRGEKSLRIDRQINQRQTLAQWRRVMFPWS